MTHIFLKVFNQEKITIQVCPKMKLFLEKVFYLGTSQVLLTFCNGFSLACLSSFLFCHQTLPASSRESSCFCQNRYWNSERTLWCLADYFLFLPLGCELMKEGRVYPAHLCSSDWHRTSQIVATQYLSTKWAWWRCHEGVSGAKVGNLQMTVKSINLKYIRFWESNRLTNTRVEIWLPGYTPLLSYWEIIHDNLTQGFPSSAHFRPKDTFTLYVFSVHACTSAPSVWYWRERLLWPLCVHPCGWSTCSKEEGCGNWLVCVDEQQPTLCIFKLNSCPSNSNTIRCLWVS